jgi:dTDP-4-amino-4,6-dideoxygalactose transaminase
MGKLDLNNPELAINGGNKIRTKPWIDNITTGEEEKKALSRVIDSGYMSLFEGSHSPDKPFSFYGGPEVQALENEWNEYYGTKYSVSVNSATSGLYMAIGALGIGYGDEVIVSPYTMTACAMAPMIYGAIPVFADVDDMGSLDPVSIKSSISSRTKAILVVHQFGIPAQMNKIMEIANEYNIKVIEDCAQAHGAKYKGQYVGTIGDIGVFSLNVNKTIQSGEGGVCTTNDEDLYYRLCLIRNHGEAVVGPAEYNHITNIAGFNYRMTELQAAVCRVQFDKLDALNVERLKLVKQLNDGLSEFDFLVVPEEKSGCESTFYVYPLKFLPEIAKIKREQFVEAINAEGINFFQGYVKPLYMQPVYQNKLLFKHGYPFSAVENKNCKMQYNFGICPNAEKLHYKQMIINEHIRPPNTKYDIDDILIAFKKVIG